MKKNKDFKDNEKEKINKECNCDESCDCGCNSEDECNCDEECNCEEEVESGCGGGCEGCSGCGGGIDPDMMIQLLSTKNHDLEEKYIRLQAEYLNFKTRTQSEIGKMLKYEGEEFIKRLLSIKDNLERAVIQDNNDLSDEVSKFLSGIKMVLGNLNAILEEFEVKEVDCLGKEFDPHFADAVLTEQDPNKPENVVIEILTKGYMYKDKLIRPAMVKVNK